MSSLFSEAFWSLYLYIRNFISGSIARYQKLRWFGKLLIMLLIVFYVALVVTFLVIGPDTIFQYFFDLSQVLRKMEYGWLILASLIVVASFPPMVGFTTLLSIAGFAWGVRGFLLALPAALVGAGLSFLSMRFLFKARLHKLQQSNRHWRALDQVVAAKGLPLIILIRFSPLPPWVYSNALFASITSVKFWQFMVANLFLSPKILLTVFVASRIAALADRDQRGQMDLPTEILNYSSIAVGIIIGVGTGWVVYRLTQEKIRSLPDLPRDVDEAAADALRDAEQGAPLLRDFSPEPEEDDVPLETSPPSRQKSLSPDRTKGRP
ncbi:Golgi apparatus membrane protein TVP38 [Serendipita indica DSM 11827]|uniref:Golgi apparatus membrane protein TVP38 n=1 Tax=Serendipita indica (strain DSM 11827) TaxID=1109443 RepID=G4TIS6_SERID|nr:Golgi apparatus membrane protein TVP38 [Serendipita indica DSM 11827]CCA71219.1 related to TVP38-Integral membrane protein localized to vesicles along with the v-SNARE Tlg2p [Serendipita indica DSM 11827]